MPPRPPATPRAPFAAAAVYISPLSICCARPRGYRSSPAPADLLAVRRMSALPVPDAAPAPASAAAEQTVAPAPAPHVRLPDSLAGASSTDDDASARARPAASTDPPRSSAGQIPKFLLNAFPLMSGDMQALDLELMPDAKTPTDLGVASSPVRKRSTFAAFTGFHDIMKRESSSSSPALGTFSAPQAVPALKTSRSAASTPPELSSSQQAISLAQILANHPGAMSSVLSDDAMHRPSRADSDSLKVFPPTPLSQRFANRAMSSPFEKVSPVVEITIGDGMELPRTADSPVPVAAEDPKFLTVEPVAAHAQTRSKQSNTHQDDAFTPSKSVTESPAQSPALDRRVSSKPSSKWSLARRMKSVTSIFKSTYVPPPYASFVSYQLQKYLETINIEQLEQPTGAVKLGAVLFSDASGFTAMTQRLAAKVCCRTHAGFMTAFAVQRRRAALHHHQRLLHQAACRGG